MGDFRAKAVKKNRRLGNLYPAVPSKVGPERAAPDIAGPLLERLGTGRWAPDWQPGDEVSPSR